MCDELSTLQDQAHGFSPTLSKQILEEELGAPVEELFSPFIEMPFAAASISQVHKAFLTREQIWVAIKVRKPNARKMFFKDMALIRRLIAIIEWCGFQPFMRWQDLGWEIEQLMREELDYRYEAANMRRMKKSLHRHNYVCAQNLSPLQHPRGLVFFGLLYIERFLVKLRRRFSGAKSKRGSR